MQGSLVQTFTLEVIDHIDAAASFFAKNNNLQPFQQLAFWRALETHAANASSGWAISHLIIKDNDQIVGFMPLFIKTHQRGEYVFDHAWADAYARYGLNYFPRLVSSIPFTPVVGERVLLLDGYDLALVWPLIFQQITELARQCRASSWHGLFIDSALLTIVSQDQRLAIRKNCQFLWSNKQYQQFDDFLLELTAKKRKNIKVERAKLGNQHIHCACLEGVDISEADWRIFYQCYVNTYLVRGQRPYLTLNFFVEIGKSMPDNLMLLMAYHNDKAIAAALFFKDDSRLYGRYWGALQHVDFLHFEVCYYQGIEYAIKHGLHYFDPGTQGEHKLIRGFAPIYTYSVHWLENPAFMDAIHTFCGEEKTHIEAYYQAALESMPFKKVL